VRWGRKTTDLEFRCGFGRFGVHAEKIAWLPGLTSFRSHSGTVRLFYVELELKSKIRERGALWSITRDSWLVLSG
jgi:hypothetical protein